MTANMERGKITAELDLADEVLTIAANRVNARPATGTTIGHTASAAVNVADALGRLAQVRALIESQL